MTDKIGIMDGAYFVGRKELLGWLNTLLEINYKKVEQISNGAAMCQVMDTMYPNKNALSKVNFNATMDFEVLNNFKILQSEFKRVGIEKVVDIERLKQGRFQDNLEFFQWMKRYYDINPHSDATTYKARERRLEAGCPEPKEVHGGLPHGSAARSSAAKRPKFTQSASSTSNSFSPVPTASQSVRSTLSAGTVAKTINVSSSTRHQPTQQTSILVSSRTQKAPGRSSQPQPTKTTPHGTQQRIHNQVVTTPPTLVQTSASSSTRTRSGSTGLKAKHVSNDSGEIKAVVSVRELTQLQETISSLEKERDFYYERLVKVETLCKSVKEGNSEAQQKYPGANKKLMSAILRILYDDGTGVDVESDGDNDNDDDVSIDVVNSNELSPLNINNYNNNNIINYNNNNNNNNINDNNNSAQSNPLLSNPITPQQSNNFGSALFSTPAATVPSHLDLPSPPSSSSSGFNMGSIGDVNTSCIGEDSVSVDNDVNMN